MMLQNQGRFLVVSGFLAPLAHGAPAPAPAIELVPNPHTPIDTPVDADTANNSTLVARGKGPHDAKVFTGSGCSGSVVAQRNDWGCWGECMNIADARSINLHQQKSGNPVPTGNMYTGSGCTDAPNGVVWRSMRLWYDC